MADYRDTQQSSDENCCAVAQGLVVHVDKGGTEANYYPQQLQEKREEVTQVINSCYQLVEQETESGNAIYPCNPAKLPVYTNYVNSSVRNVLPDRFGGNLSVLRSGPARDYHRQEARAVQISYEVAQADDCPTIANPVFNVQDTPRLRRVCGLINTVIPFPVVRCLNGLESLLCLVFTWRG